MLINHTTKNYWWGPMRTGSREVGRFLKENGFELVGGEHEPIIVDGSHLFLNCRNPYTRMVSWWKFRTKQTDPLIDQDGREIYTNDDTTFEEWVMGNNEYYGQIEGPWDYVKIIKDNNIPFTKIPLEDLSILSTFGQYSNRGSGVWQKPTSETIKPYREYYTPILAHRVYDMLKDEFEMMGYERDSWKTI